MHVEFRGYYYIREIQDEVASSYIMSYYKLSFDGETLKGDNVNASGQSVGKISMKKIESFKELEGTYIGAGSIDGQIVNLVITVQKSEDGYYHATCQFNAADGTQMVEDCRILDYYGTYYLMGVTWSDGGSAAKRDLTFGLRGGKVNGSVWADGSCLGLFNGSKR